MSDCPKRLDGQHIYGYDGNNFVCKCGKVVEYDILKRDFEGIKK